VASLRRELSPEQLTKLAASGSAGLAAAGGTSQWAGQAALGNRPWISHRSGDEAQEDPWDEATGETRRAAAGAGDGSDVGELTPLPEAALAQAVAAAKAAAKANAPAIATVLILACNRPQYLERTMDAVTRVHSGDPRFPLVISQDGFHEATAEVAQAAATRHGLHFMQHEQGPLPKKEKASDNPVYYRIAAHYHWALDKLFEDEATSLKPCLDDAVARQYTKLKKSTQIQNQLRGILGYTNAQKGIQVKITTETLALALGLDKVLIGKGRYNTADEGQADTMGFIWPSNYAFLMYQPDVNAEVANAAARKAASSASRSARAAAAAARSAATAAAMRSRRAPSSAMPVEEIVWAT
jgi:hypothetical protein